MDKSLDQGEPASEATGRSNAELEEALCRFENLVAEAQDSQAKYEAIVEAFDGLIYICSPQYEVEFMNERFIHRTGYNPVGEKCYRVLHGLDDICPWCVNERVQQGETVRWEVQSPKDHRWYYIVNTPIPRRDGSISKMAVIQDITDRKHAEEALRQSEQLLKNILSSSPLGICYMEDGKLRWVNHAMATIFHEEREELFLGQSSREFYSSEDEYQRVRQTFYQCLPEGKPADTDATFRRKDGSVFHGHLRLCALDPSRPREGTIAILSDITDRKQAEQTLRDRTEALERSNKDLEQFAYVAAHDLREPLLAVTAYLKVLERGYNTKLDGEARRLIVSAVESTLRMDTLIQSLLAYSRLVSAAPSFEPVDCETVLQGALANLHSVIHQAGATVTSDPLPTVVGTRVQLVQLFQNLIANAIKFRGEEAPRIHVGAVRRSGEWEFSVRDNGVGIEPPFFERIFLIFQRVRTGPEYPGTGIGLANCRKIVERHGGRIWVESQPGEGSTFFFTIPETEAGDQSLPWHDTGRT